MQKTITVRGTGRATAKPDTVHILFQLVNRNKQYLRAMNDASKDLENLKKSLQSVGMSPDELKTMNFCVDTDRKYVDGHYVFECFAIHHKFKIVMDFDRESLGRVLSAVTKSCSDPALTVKFTVKDQTAIKDELFATAAANARNIAESLCKGSGATLGELLSINYSWQEVDFYSHTEAAPQGSEEGGSAECDPPEINPDDIEASDSVTFVWALE